MRLQMIQTTLLFTLLAIGNFADARQDRPDKQEEKADPLFTATAILAAIPANRAGNRRAPREPIGPSDVRFATRRNRESSRNGVLNWTDM
jgi:hypothetical protein